MYYWRKEMAASVFLPPENPIDKVTAGYTVLRVTKRIILAVLNNMYYSTCCCISIDTVLSSLHELVFNLTNDPMRQALLYTNLQIYRNQEHRQCDLLVDNINSKWAAAKLTKQSRNIVLPLYTVWLLLPRPLGTLKVFDHSVFLFWRFKKWQK